MPFAQRRVRPYLLAGWLWFIITLLPVIGFIQVGAQAMADRYAYVPFLGLFVAVVWLVADSAAHLRVSVPAIAALALLVLASYGYVSYRQIGYWRNSFTLFSHAVKVTSRNAIAEDNLGATLTAMGHPDLAEAHIEAAIGYMPRLSTAHYNYGVLLHTQGHLEQAVSQYRLALQYVSDTDEAARDHNNLGSALNQLGQPDAAVQEYSAAIKINPKIASSVFLSRRLPSVTSVAGLATMIPELRNPMVAMNRPMPAATAAYSSGGIASTINCRIPTKVRIKNATPDRNTAPSAVSQGTPIPLTTV